jgi:TetR/AcrR family transcriptional repressor of nem operon
LEGFTVWKTRLGGIVEEGIRRGEIRDDVEPRRIANVMVATLEGALMMSRLEGDRTAIYDARVMLESMLDGISAAVLPDGPTARGAVTS